MQQADPSTKPNKPTTTTTTTRPSQTSSKQTYTAIASAQPPTTKPQAWTTIGAKGPIKPQKPKEAKRIENRVILTQENPLPKIPPPSFSPLAIRNTFNNAFKAKGVLNPVVATISRSITGNIVVTTTPTFDADFLLSKKSIWDGIIPFKKAQKPQEWFKVVVHGIPTSDFNNSEGMRLIVDEIKTFNKNLSLIGLLY